MSETGLDRGPFDEKQDDQNGRFIRTAVFTLAFGILGIGTSLGAVYFFAGGNASSPSDQLRAALGSMVEVREAPR
jgi:hypothetical protein